MLRTSPSLSFVRYLEEKHAEIPAEARQRAAIVRRSPSARVWLLAGVILFVHASLIVLSARSTELAADELPYFNVGHVIIRHGFVHADTRYQGPLALYANQLFVPDFPSGGLDLVAPQAELVFRGRLGTLPFALLGAVLVFLWAHRLYGDAGGLLALLTLALNPLLVGYGSLMLVDAQHAAMTLLALFVLWRYLETGAKKLLPWVGFTLGLALATKYLAVFLAPPVGLTVAIAAALRSRDGKWPGGLAAGAGALALVAASALLTLHTAYLFREGIGAARPEDFTSDLMKDVASTPVLGSLTALLPPPFLRGVDFQLAQSQRNWKPFLNGVFQHGHPDYYLWTILCKTPEIVLMLGLLVLVLRLPLLLQADSPAGWRTTAAATLPFALLLFAYVSLSPMQLGVRYILPLFPLLCLLIGAFAWNPAVGVTGERVPGVRILAAGALLAALLGLDIARNWPDWISYYNRVSGGQALAFRRFRDTVGDRNSSEVNRLQSLRACYGDFQLLEYDSGARFGRLAIDISGLNSRTAGCDWLTWVEPVAHQGASWWIFEVTPEAFEARVQASGDAELRRDLAVAHLGAGRREEARRHIAELEPARARPLLALIAAEDVARARPEREPLEALIQAWQAVGRPDRAEAVALEHPTELAGSLLALRARVQALEERRDYAGATELIEASEIQPAHNLQLVLATYLRRIGRWDRAKEAFDAFSNATEGRVRSPQYQELASDIEQRTRLAELLR